MSAPRPPLGELADRLRPVTDAERRLPECHVCGSTLIRVGLTLRCERCGAPEPPEAA